VKPSPADQLVCKNSSRRCPQLKETMTPPAMGLAVLFSLLPRPSQDQLTFVRPLVNSNPQKALNPSSGACPFPRTYRIVLSAERTHTVTLQIRTSNWLVQCYIMRVLPTVMTFENVRSYPGPTTWRHYSGLAKAPSLPPTQPPHCYANLPTTGATIDTSPLAITFQAN